MARSSVANSAANCTPLDLQPRLQVDLEAAVDGLLGRAQRVRGPGGELPGERHAPRRRPSSGATTRSTRPIRSASSAPTKRPVKMRSLARAGPTSRGSRCVPPAPGMMPSRISGWPSRALSPATRRSQHSASSQPPPRAYPVTAAIVGLGIRATAVKADCRATERSTICWYDQPTISFTSAPAAKTFGPP